MVYDYERGERDPRGISKSRQGKHSQNDDTATPYKVSQMAKIEVSTVINRPVEEVFAVLSNEANTSKWSTTTMEVKKTSEGPIGVGTTWRGVDRIFGRQMERESVYTEYEPNRKSSRKVPPVPCHLKFNLFTSRLREEHESP